MPVHTYYKTQGCIWPSSRVDVQNNSVTDSGSDLFTSSEGIVKVVQAFETSVTVSNSIQYSRNCIHMVFLKVIM